MLKHFTLPLPPTLGQHIVPELMDFSIPWGFLDGTSQGNGRLGDADFTLHLNSHQYFFVQMGLG